MPGGTSASVTRSTPNESDGNSVLFREALSRIVSAVHIVTSNGPAGRTGMTASAVIAVAVDPAIISFPLMPEDVRCRGSSVTVSFASILLLPTTNQPPRHSQSRRIGKRRFEIGDWRMFSDGYPFLSSAVAAIHCRTMETKRVANHVLLIG